MRQDAARAKQLFETIFLSVFLVLVPLTCFIHAQEPDRIDKVVVTGVGVDADKARQNAIRNAVEQVIGTYVSSDTMVQNSQLLKDEILSYSGGYVKESRVISQEKGDGGLFSIKLEAQVVATKLKRKIQSLNIALKKVEGESLFAEAFSKMEEKKSGGELLSRILAKYPQAAYQFDVGKPEIESTDPRSGMATLSITIKIKWDEAFLSELREVLSRVAKQEFSLVEIDSLFKGKNRNLIIGNKIIDFSKRNLMRSGKAEVCLVLDASPWADDRFRRSLFNLPVSSDCLSLFLTFKDKRGVIIDSTTYKFQPQDTDSWQRQRIALDLKAGAPDWVYEGFGYSPPNILWRDPDNRHLLILVDGTFQVNVKASVDASILKDVSYLEVTMNAFPEVCF